MEAFTIFTTAVWLSESMIGVKALQTRKPCESLECPHFMPAVSESNWKELGHAT